MNSLRTRIFTFLVLTLNLVNIEGQIQSKIWYFGNQAGLDFNTDPPTPLFNPNINNQESNATLTDGMGNLLFYVTADRIYNKLHQIMDNGLDLLGNGGSSAQGPMIVQDPGNETRYYVFMTADETFPDYKGNLRYSVVDLCENNGLGKVVPGLKNVQIPGSFSERLTAIPLKNGKAFWIICSVLFENTIISFYLDSIGIHVNNPVVSFFGSEFSPQVGQIKVNNRKTQILYSAGLNTSGNGVWLMDYDTINGMAKNIKVINSGSHDYGLEFSPDDKLVYYTSFYVTSGVYQYELISGITTALFEHNSNYYVASITRDPHNRLIVSSGIKGIVSVILSPNIIGFQCNYLENYVKLLPNTTGHFGVQNTSIVFDNELSVSNGQFLGQDTMICAGTELLLTTPSPRTVWSTGQKGGSIKISDPGTYWAYLDNNCNRYFDSISVGYYNFPDLLYQDKIILCDGLMDTLSTSEVVIWNDGTTGNELIVDQGGIYWAKVSSPCGDVVDSVEVKYIDKLEQPAALVDTVLCSDRPVDYSIHIKEAVWNTGEMETLHIKSPGYYSYTITNECEQLRDSFRLSLDSIPLPLPERITACKGETIVLYSGNPRSLWNTGPTGNKLLVQQSGRYGYSLDNACGSFFYSTDIDFIDDGSEHYLPNVFSPNGDQINDLFPGRTFSSDFSIKIYDRWGELVFEGLNASWDGTQQSRPMPPGAYVYLMELETCLGPTLKSGTVTLLR